MEGNPYGTECPDVPLGPDLFIYCMRYPCVPIYICVKDQVLVGCFPFHYLLKREEFPHSVCGSFLHWGLFEACSKAPK